MYIQGIVPRHLRGVSCVSMDVTRPTRQPRRRRPPMASTPAPPAPERFFAERYGLTSARLEGLLGSATTGGVDHADVYIEHQVGEELLLEDGVVKKASRTISQEAGVRAHTGARTGYARTDDLAVANLELAARQAQH